MMKKLLQILQKMLFIGTQMKRNRRMNTKQFVQDCEYGNLGSEFKDQDSKFKDQGSKRTVPNAQDSANNPCSPVPSVSSVCHSSPVLQTSGMPTPPLPIMLQIKEVLSSRYDFRFNLLTEQPEYRRKDSDEEFRMADQRVANTLCIEAQMQGIPCWDKDINRLLCSLQVADYHPFRAYMDALPAWDGIDRITPLALRVSDKPVWLMGFHRWMRGMAAQWMNLVSRSANAVAPLIVSTEQGLCKSTFCSLLMPPQLQGFYLDKFDITSVSGCEQKLSHFGLINMDEFDRYSERAMATLKNLMQLRHLNVRKSHRSYYSQLPRIASFIGTSNRRELLTDLTGSRRFLCIEINSPIDCSPINHSQLYAQLKHELEQGLPHWFTHDEELLIQESNRPFYRHSPEHEVFFRCFRLPNADEEAVRLSATDIFLHLQKRFPAAMRGRNANSMGKTLSSLGIERIHTSLGNVYRVIPVRQP